MHKYTTSYISLILQRRSTKIADSHKILKDYILRIKSLKTSPGDKTIDAMEAEKLMVFWEFHLVEEVINWLKEISLLNQFVKA